MGIVMQQKEGFRALSSLQKGSMGFVVHMRRIMDVVVHMKRIVGDVVHIRRFKGVVVHMRWFVGVEALYSISGQLWVL